MTAGGQGWRRSLYGLQRLRSSLARCSSALRKARPRFSSASDWLVVAASTPAAATLTGKGGDIDRGRGERADNAATEEGGENGKNEDAHRASVNPIAL